MLNRLFDSTNTYNVYVDIKDTHSAQRTEKLEEVLANSHYDFNHECIKKVQPIRSDEVQMMQITDVINGAVCRANRTTIPQPSGAKAEIIDYIRMRSKLRLTQSTTLGTRKFNIFVWEGRNRKRRPTENGLGFSTSPASKTTQPARGMSICVDVSGSGFHGRRLTTQRIVRNAIMRYVMRH